MSPRFTTRNMVRLSSRLGIPAKALSKQQKAVVFGSWFGWSLDGYDLVLMLFVISSVNQLFFPSNDPTLSLLATFATYIVALAMRPVGGCYFWKFRRQTWKKKSNDNNNLGFSIVTFLTGLLPTWHTAHVLSSYITYNFKICSRIICWRRMGKWFCNHNGNSTKNMRGLLSGFVQSGYSFGFVIASLAYGSVLIVYPGQSFTELGWRVMFFTGIIPGLLALFIRLKMDESEIWLKKLKERRRY